MKLSDGEKLILLMLCDISSGKKELNPDLISSAIVGNHLWGIRWAYPGIPFEPHPDPDEVSFVVDVLDMWYFIEESYKHLSLEDKKHVTDSYGLEPRWEGFDGNNEGEYLSIVRFLTDELARFSVFKERAAINSHSPKFGRYQAMLSKFLPLRAGLWQKLLTSDQLLSILER